MDTKEPSTTDDNVTLGRWLGISHKVGTDMCYWVLTVSGNVVSRTTVQDVSRDDLLHLVMKEKIKLFDEALDKRLDNTKFTDDQGTEFYIDDLEDADAAAHGDGSQTPSDADYGDMLVEERPDRDDVDDEAFNKYIGAEVMMELSLIHI